jgi:RNA polymerase sigma-70 factor (ECF subfamily)
VKDDDRKTVDAIRSGDAAAFQELYERHCRRVHSFALRRLGDRVEAEDVVQEVFTAVYTGLERYEGKSDLVVWIYGITRNILNNRLRRRGGVRLLSLDDLPPESAPLTEGPGSQAEARQTLVRLSAAIDQLPAEQRRILELRHGRRMAIRKIAEVTGRSEDAIKSSLYRARRSLAAHLPTGTAL